MTYPLAPEALKVFSLASDKKDDQQSRPRTPADLVRLLKYVQANLGQIGICTMDLRVQETQFSEGAHAHFFEVKNICQIEDARLKCKAVVELAAEVQLESALEPQFLEGLRRQKQHSAVSALATEDAPPGDGGRSLAVSEIGVAASESAQTERTLRELVDDHEKLHHRMNLYRSQEEKIVRSRRNSEHLSASLLNLNDSKIARAESGLDASAATNSKLVAHDFSQGDSRLLAQDLSLIDSNRRLIDAPDRQKPQLALNNAPIDLERLDDATISFGDAKGSSNLRHSTTNRAPRSSACASRSSAPSSRSSSSSSRSTCSSRRATPTA